MEMRSRLAAIKRKALRKIEEAAASRNTRLVSSLSALATRAEEDEEILTMLEERIKAYESEIGSDDPQDLRSILDLVLTGSRKAGSAKSRGRGDAGEVARNSFVEAGKGRGYSLTPVSGINYRTAGGKIISMPFATERRPNRWFLGIADERPDLVVLLCRNETGSILDFVVPSSMISETWRDLSRNGGQVKFNVSRTGPDYWLVVPKHGKKRINEYLGAYGYFKK